MKEIDIIGWAKKVLSEPKKLIISCAISAVIGVVVALSSPKFYTTTVVLAPEATDASALSSKIGSVSSLLGIKMGSSMMSEALYPQLYPDILASTDFLSGLFDIPVQKTNDTKTKTYYQHLTQDVKVPFWQYPKLWIAALTRKKETPSQNSGSLRLTRAQYQVCEVLRGLIFCSIDKKTEVISISVTDFDPLISATMADSVTKRLQQYITMYRTQKARHDLTYTEKMFEQSKADYLEAQKAYTQIIDANQNAFLYSMKSKIQNLKDEMDLKYQVYSELTTQLQIAKQRVQERIPAFTVIQSAIVPYQPSGTPRSIIVLLFIFLGAAADAAWILFLRDMYSSYKRSKQQGKRNEKELAAQSVEE